MGGNVDLGPSHGGDATDAELVAHHLAGDAGVMAALVARYLRPVFGYVYRLCGSAADAEDITQESFLKAWRNLSRYRPELSFKAWLFTIARRSAIDWLRKRRDVPLSSFDNEAGENELTGSLADTQPLPDELADRALAASELEGLLDALKPIYREVLLLHYRQGLTFEEIGQVVGRPLDTVKSQHRRALATLRAALLHHGGDPERIG